MKDLASNAFLYRVSSDSIKRKENATAFTIRVDSIQVAIDSDGGGHLLVFFCFFYRCGNSVRVDNEFLVEHFYIWENGRHMPADRTAHSGAASPCGAFSQNFRPKTKRNKTKQNVPIGANGIARSSQCFSFFLLVVRAGFFFPSNSNNDNDIDRNNSIPSDKIVSSCLSFSFSIDCVPKSLTEETWPRWHSIGVQRATRDHVFRLDQVIISDTFDWLSKIELMVRVWCILTDRSSSMVVVVIFGVLPILISFIGFSGLQPGITEFFPPILRLIPCLIEFYRVLAYSDRFCRVLLGFTEF